MSEGILLSGRQRLGFGIGAISTRAASARFEFGVGSASVRPLDANLPQATENAVLIAVRQEYKFGFLTHQMVLVSIKKIYNKIFKNQID